MTNNEQAAHKHVWQPNGTVEIDRISISPCSTWDDLLWTDVVSVQVCQCGTVRKVRIGRKNARHRGDDLRKGK